MPSFRTKARAIDLLGKGQIADLPTAISELWKNGYDAYADELSCDLYLTGFKSLTSPIFLLSDNGYGMSENDLIEKWIVIGTESKARSSTTQINKKDTFGKSERVPMGEKGIGRLSAAFLGNQMLMLTKKSNDNCLSLFIDWRIFENYNLYLDDVNIPIKTINTIDDLNKMLKILLTEFGYNLSNGNWSDHSDLSKKIKSEMDQISFPDFLKKQLRVFFNKENHGTIFIIFKPNELLIDLSEGDKEIQESAVIYLKSFLSGINNLFVNEVNFEPHFWIHNNVGKYDIIDKQAFFTREEMLNADHYFTGNFDENGFFNGEVRIFDKKFKHTFRAHRSPGETPYGPFKIEFGFMEGNADSSIHTKDKWLDYSKKLDRFGGLYVYRDGFRVLPYGKKEYDFLKFEERRSFRAGDYFFSHRRLFGYISIGRHQNGDLKDKAGREGFISNPAYREFQRDLIEFFVDLAFRYLHKREDTPRSSYLKEREKEKLKEKAAAEERKRNKDMLLQFKKKIKENRIELNNLFSQVTDIGLCIQKKNISNDELYNIIKNINDAKYKLNNLKTTQPMRVELTESVVNDFYKYDEKYEEVKLLIKNYSELILSIREQTSKDELNNELNNLHINYLNDIKKQLYDYKLRLQKKNNEILNGLNKDNEFYINQYIYKTKPILSENNQNIKENLMLVERLSQEIIEEIDNKYQPFVSHIEGLNHNINDDILIGWYKDQYSQLTEKIEAMYELAQLGMAIEIIDHQFNVLYSEMSAAINYFKTYAKNNPEIEENYHQLKIAFEHLESNHQLLTPLYRTTRRNKVIISGSEIRDYINKFFELSFNRHHITFSTDVNFDNYEFDTFESIIKPIFINIINNAIYWLTPTSDRKIFITVKNDKILIINSGEKIEKSDEKKIFNLFFTRKPGGRGIGLYLAKINLQTIDYEIEVSNDKEYNMFGGACFVITKKAGGEK